MRIETIIITCDSPGCPGVYESNRTGGAAFVGTGWVRTADGDFCPEHAPDAYWCGVCGQGFPAVEAFDGHRKQCRKGARR